MNHFKARFFNNQVQLIELPFSLSPGKSILVGNLKGQADLRVPEDSVSRKHLYIAMDANGGLLVCDAGSSNGSFVENLKLATNSWHPIQKNERFLLGQEVSCEIIDDDLTFKQAPSLPHKSKPIKKAAKNSKDNDVNPRIKINFEPNIHIPKEPNSNTTQTVSLTGLAIVGALICAALTNPSKQNHLDAISEKYPSDKTIERKASSTEYRNFIVYSALSVTPEVMSIGLLKNIIVINPKKVKEELEN
jgi:hypothetical protein